jgi:hypothetical protein
MVEHASAWPWSSYGAMVGRQAPPPWLETDWLLGQFGSERKRALPAYAAFVNEGVGRPGIWNDLRHQIYLGGERFVEQFSGMPLLPDRLREVPRAQRRALSKPLSHFEQRYPDQRDAMARAFLSGAYTMLEVAAHFGGNYSTVSRAVRRFAAPTR